MPNPYIFKTRALGPNAKNSTLTFDELDNSLLFLSSSIGTLNGLNSFFVQANGTPLQNGYSLIDSYNTAKTTAPTGSNRYAVLLGPGNYEFTQSFNINTPYIDVVSLTGYKDVYITGSNTIQVSTDNVYVRGIDVGSKNFTITSSLPNTIFKNCKGGNSSFGGSISSSLYIISSTFIDCEGGSNSFAGEFGTAEGTFTNCIGGNNSFGFDCDGIFNNCQGGNFSFGGLVGTIEADCLIKDCVGGSGSFSPSGAIDGILQNCTLILGNFTPHIYALSKSGKIIDCKGNPDNLITNSLL
jgi:hypothetical protein